MKRNHRLLNCSLFVLFLVIIYWLGEYLYDDAAGQFEKINLPNMDFGDEPGRVSRAKSKCPINRLNSTDKNFRKQSCKVRPPAESSCNMAQKLFFSKPTSDCSHQTRYEFCRLKQSSGKSDVKCQVDGYKRVDFGILNPDDGRTTWSKMDSTAELESAILARISRESPTKHFGFCYIRCTVAIGGHRTQLLVLPPKLPNVEPINPDKELISINIVLIDSASRQHFFRSFPKTIGALQNVRKDKNTPTHVLDFELAQGIKSRTFENAQAMLSGKIDLKKKPFDDFLQLPPKAMAIETLFGPLKNNGYQTLWLEDLCWSKDWGISKSLRVADRQLSSAALWKKLQKALGKAAIDDLGITYSVCDVLESLNKTDPFHGLDSVCFNGRHHHEDYFEYLTLYQKQLSEKNIPYINFYENNVGHDEFGRRIQTLDKTLATYATFVSKLRKTLTIFFSDHGNTYGPYIDSVQGRMEVYHPFMFMIVPPDAARILGKKKMAALRVNQHRLMSVLDTHYTLMSLIPNREPLILPQHKVYGVNPSGLFDEVPESRTCDHIPMFPQSLCICDGQYETPAKNDPPHALIAEFALGKLNNELHRQFVKQHRNAKSGFGSCSRIVAHRFGNVRESHSNIESRDYIIRTKLDLYVRRPGDPTFEEIFFVAVESTVGERSNMVLISYSRMSTYSIFKPCADDGVALQLCVCDIKTSKNVNYLQSPLATELGKSVFRVETKAEKATLGGEHCFLLFSRKNDYGVALEIANVCQRPMSVGLTLETKNLDLSESPPHTLLLHAGEIKFVGVARQSIIQRPWTYNFRIERPKTKHADDT